MKRDELISTIDHLVFASYSLDDGVDFISQQLGAAPERGGHHVMMGTHNKLLKLDNSTYLEIIAIDPGMGRPKRPRWFALDNLQPGSKPTLLTWVLRTNNIQQAVSRSTLRHGAIESMQRGIYSWLITIPANAQMPMQGVAPTLIQWQGEHHPADDLPASDISLLKIEAFHPDANALNDALDAIGFEGKFSATAIGLDEDAFLRVTLMSPKGIIRFES